MIKMKKLLLSVLVFASFILQAQWEIYDMVLYYPVEGHINEETIFDISGFETHGTLTNVTTTTDRFGRPDGAIEFNGLNSQVYFNSPYFSKPEYCYSVWVKQYEPTPYGEADLVISIGADYGVDHFLMNTNNYSLNNHTGWLGGGYHEDQTHAFVRTQVMADVGEWLHITYMRNEEMLRLFVNGELVATSTENVQAPYFGTDFMGTLGCRVNRQQYFYGAMDDIKIFEKLLSDDEVKENYQLSGIPEPFVHAGNDSVLVSATKEVQLDAKAFLFSSLEWRTNGDGTFSDPDIVNPLYYPGLNDLNNTEGIILTVTVKGQTEQPSNVTDSIKLRFDLDASINENANGQNLEVYPNPIRENGVFYISSVNVDLTKVSIVRVRDLNGKTVRSLKVNCIDQNLIRMKIDKLNTGIYFIELDGKIIRQKIITLNQ